MATERVFTSHRVAKEMPEMAAASQRQWIPLQRQLLPKTKEAANQYQKNARRRHREAVENALRKGYLKLLDEDLILGSQLESEGAGAPLELRDVRRISLRDSHVQAVDDIAMLSCERLRLCSLEDCYVSDISAFYGCVNLLRLDVSNNQVERLPSREFWSTLASLRVLYLNGNAISRLECVSGLSGCPQLHILTLHDTPISLTRTYRHHVVNSIVTLRALDHHVISDEEIIENLQVTSRFKPLMANFRLQLHQSSPKGTPFKEELRTMYGLMVSVDRVLARFSPVMVIQRWARGWLLRKAMARSPTPKMRMCVRRPRVDGPPARTQPEPQGHPSPTHLSPRHKSKSKGTQITHSVPLPPPPPTSPAVASPRRDHHTPKQRFPLSLETHVLGMDTDSSKLKYSMHINLHKLHQNVLEAEGSEGVTEFWSAFQRRSPNKPTAVVRPTKQPKQISPRRKKGDKTGPQSQTPLNDTTTSNAQVVTEEIDVPSEQTVELDSKPGDTGKEQALEDGDIEVAGRTVQAVAHDRVAAMVVSNKESGKMIRDAEKEIKETVTRARQPPPRPEKTRNPNIMTKDELAFTQTYTSMTLSAARSLEKAHQARKKAEKLIQKAELVSKVKQERVERKAKIEGFHRELKDNNASWKASEDSRLAELRKQQHTKKAEDLLTRTQQHDTTVTHLHQQTEDRTFACEFNQQHTLVGLTLTLEDQRLAKEARLQEVQARVQRARDVSQEHQEMVRRYMELRRTKLLREGTAAKTDVDTKMIEAASHRLMECQRKVAREVARRRAARASIALARENLGTADRPRPPTHPQTTVRVDLSEPNGVRDEPQMRREGFLERLQEHRIPVAMRRFSREAHRTWQRGTHVISERQAALMGTRDHTHFPLITRTEETPLMYEMMKPGPTLRTVVTPPGEVESSTSSTSDGVSLPHRQLTVR